MASTKETKSLGQLAAINGLADVFEKHDSVTDLKAAHARRATAH